MKTNLREIKDESIIIPETKEEGFMDRLREMSVALGYRSLQSFQVSLGYTNSYFRNIKKINREAEARIRAKHPEANIDYLRTGEGSLFIESSKLPSEERADVNYVPLLPISAIGGSLNDFEPSVMEWECEKIVSPIKDATRAITVTGDSMSPEYPNGCIIFIKRIDENIFIEWGRTYVLDTENGIVVKNVFPCEEEKNKVVCRSVNRNYADFTIPREYIRGWYRVLCQMAQK